MKKLYQNDVNKFKKWFKESAQLLGVDVQYKYVIKRKAEEATGESVYSDLSEPITQSVIIESGVPKVESLKQLGWFVGVEDNEQLLVDFAIDTPNLQEGCRFTFQSNENDNQTKEYVVIKLSNELLYPSCIKCLCIPVIENATQNINGDLQYGQQEITSDSENYSFINEKKKLTMF